jgi:hypothetical protein
MSMGNRRIEAPRRRATTGLLAGLLLAGAAFAQTAPAPHATPRPDQLEPGVDTTRSLPADSPAPVSAAPPATPPMAAPAAPAAHAAAPAAKAAAPAAGAPRSGAAAPAKKGADRLDLEATAVKGNRELPRVMYVVPWKRSDLGDIVGRPVNSLLDEVMQPVDRDVFRRENRYYDALKPDAAVGAKSDAVPGSGVNP